MNHDHDQLLVELAQFAYDPLGFVYWAFPWGEPGELADHRPEQWQIDLLAYLTAELRLGSRDLAIGRVIRIARTSGHGVGKSALVSWIILWAMATMPDTVGVVTANTETQLKTKTWVQLAKWHRLFIARSLFAFTATKLCSVDPAHENTWRMDMVPWSERNTEAFAGLHNQGRRILVIFDEASAIPDVIWEVTEGALTDKGTEIIWACFGNPTRNSGRFRACFPGGQFERRWNSATVDSRIVSFTNKTQLEEWRQDYGEDSDFYRIRVKGMFPRHDSDAFISLELARAAADLRLEDGSQSHHPVVLGVDVARKGKNFSVIYPRQGRDARSRMPEAHQGLDTMQLVSRITAARKRYDASALFVDEGGVGGGVVDRLRQLREPVIGVQFGGRPDGTNEIEPGVRYKNKRAEIWGAMREWLYSGGAIPHNIPGIETPFPEELAGPNYTYNDGADCIQLEAKKDMESRGVPSPDAADALATTFAYPHFVPEPVGFGLPASGPECYPDYNPYSTERLLH